MATYDLDIAPQYRIHMECTGSQIERVEIAELSDWQPSGKVEHFVPEEQAALLREKIKVLQRALLGYILDAGLRQDIEPPGEWEDYPFSEDTREPKL